MIRGYKVGTIIAWNTGRLYTDYGQRIAAQQVPDGRVVFVDIDRGIHGITREPCVFSREAVQHAYDYTEYNGLMEEEHRALEKGLMTAAMPCVP